MEEKSAKIKKIIENLRQKYGDKYGAVVFDVDFKEKKGKAELAGRVLAEKQKSEVANEFKNAGIGITRNDIKIAGDPEEKLESGWGKINEEIVDILGKYAAGGFLTPRAVNKFRATQLKKGEIVRILAEEENQVLIQSEDLAIGWADKSKIKYQKSNIKNQWSNKIRAQKNKVFRAIPPKEADMDKFIKNFLGAPYVLGGTTEKGLDCSALTQKFYRELYGLILPRHSQDQAECGRTVKNMEKARVGDSVFLKLKNNGHYHIGVIIDIAEESEKANPGDIWVFNARRDNGGAVVQSLEEILKDYKLLDIRRIIKVKN